MIVPLISSTVMVNCVITSTFLKITAPLPDLSAPFKVVTGLNEDMNKAG